MSAGVGPWASVRGYVAEPPARILPHDGGFLVVHDGQRTALRLDHATGRLLASVAANGLLAGPIPLPGEPRLARLLEKLAALGFLRRVLAPVASGLPTVAIIVPAYGRAAMVARCVAALRALDYPAELLDIVVVDDASDDAGATARAGRGQGAQVVTRTVNGGPAAARDSGIRATQSELIAFVDTDCIVEPTWLMRLVLELSDPLVAAAASRVQTVQGDDWVSAFEAIRSPLDMGTVFGDLDPRGPRFFCPTADLVVKRAAYERCGGFDVGLRVGEDVDLCLRLMARGGRIRYLPDPLVVHEAPRRPSQIARRRYAYARSESFLWVPHPVTRGGIRRGIPRFAACLAVMAALGHRRPVLAHSTAVAAVAAAAALTDGSGGRGRHPLARLTDPGFALGRLTSVLTNLSRYHAVPLLVGETALRRSVPLVAVGCIVGAAMCDFVTLKPAVRPADYVALHALEDVAYSAGVTAGALRPAVSSAIARTIVHRLLHRAPGSRRPRPGGRR